MRRFSVSGEVSDGETSMEGCVPVSRDREASVAPKSPADLREIGRRGLAPDWWFGADS